MPPKRIRCTPEQIWCEENAGPSRFGVIATPELLGEVAACGVGCTGELSEILKREGECGLPGAIMDAMCWQLVREGKYGTYDESRDAMLRIFGGEDPAQIITNPPGRLKPGR